MNSGDPEVLTLVLGQLQTNCYLVVCPTTRSAMVIDPADAPDRILAAAGSCGATVDQILLTHVHPDHLLGLPGLKQATGAKVMAHRLDAQALPQIGRFFGLRQEQISSLLPDVQLEDGQELSIGELSATVIHTPGHTPGGITLRVGQHLFTGDTLFAQGVGRVDFPGGDLNTLLNSIQRLFALPDDCIVHPGHGPASTIGTEKLDNPYA